jgi:hypothetical protein
VLRKDISRGATFKDRQAERAAMGVGGVLYHGHGYKKKKTTGTSQHEHLHDVGSDNTKKKEKWRCIIALQTNRHHSCKYYESSA